MLGKAGQDNSAVIYISVYILIHAVKDPQLIP